MNRDVKPLHALLVIAFFLLLVAAYALANGESLKHLGAQALYKNNNNHLFVLIDTDLLEFDGLGVYIETHGLKQLGVDVFIGEILFVDEYKILIRKGPVEKSLFENTRAYLRLDNVRNNEPVTIESGLFLCDLKINYCNRFTHEKVDYDAAFSLATDVDDGSIYVADTSRHVLIKYNEKGVELARKNDDLKFPNDMSVKNGMLVLANTNRHVISIIRSDINQLVLEKNIDVVPEEASKGGETWPAVIEQVNDDWWILNMESDMGHGGVYRFNSAWDYLGRLINEPDADPADILQWKQDEVLVADPYNYKVDRYSSHGHKLMDFMPDQLAMRLSIQKTSRNHYALLSYIPVGLFVIAMIVGFVYGVRSEISVPVITGTSETNRSGESTFKSTKLIWLEKDEKLKKKIDAIFLINLGLMVLLVLATIVMQQMISGSLEMFKLMYIYLALMTVLFVAAYKYLKLVFKTKIGIQGDSLVLIDHRGRKVSGRVADVFYDAQTLVLKDVAVMYGSKKWMYFSKQEIESRLMPLLEQAKRLNAMQMFLRLYKLKHPYVYFIAFISVFALASLMIIYLDGTFK